MEQPQRKNLRIPNFDYAQNGAYFLTICTLNRLPILSRITVYPPENDGDPGIAVELLHHGVIAHRHLHRMAATYPELSLDNFVVMPDHIHILLTVKGQQSEVGRTTASRFVGTFKRFCNREYGENIWQSRFYDHVIRNQADYNEVYEYISNNPMRWAMKNRGRE